MTKVRILSSKCLLAILLFYCFPSFASAADVSQVSTHKQKDDVEASDLAIYFSVGLVSDYVSRGITNSDSKPAVQAYLEPSLGPFYMSIFSSNVDYGSDFRGAEIDVGAGIRPEVGNATLDFGYVHYLYAPEEVSPDYGEVYAKIAYSESSISLGAQVVFAPDYLQSGQTATYVEGSLGIPLPRILDGLTLSGALGYQFFEDPSEFQQWTWNIGLTYLWNDLTFDLRYWDTDLSGIACIDRSGFSTGCDARLVGSISIATSWVPFKKQP